ncbi:hypothetical protein ABIB62_002339 [Mucilaginibacter sp. UYP25]
MKGNIPYEEMSIENDDTFIRRTGRFKDDGRIVDIYLKGQSGYQ